MSVDNIVKVKIEDGTEKKAYVRKPTRTVISGADMHRAKVWSNCIEQGIKTKMQLAKQLEELGIWTEENDQEQKDVMQKIADLEKELFLTEGKKDIQSGKDIVLEMKRQRMKLRMMIINKTSFDENSAEAIADNSRFDYLASQCIYNEENTEKVYNSLEDYNENGNDDFAFHAAAKLAEIIYGDMSDVEKDYPENKWMEKLGLTNKDGNLVDVEGNLVDIDGRKIDDKGHYLNEKGEIVDIDGNLLNDDGTYVLKTEYETAPPKKKRGRPAKVAE